VLRAVQAIDLSTGEYKGPRLDAGGIVLDAEFSPAADQVAAAVSLAASPQERAASPGKHAGLVLLWGWPGGEPRGEPIRLPSEPRGLAYCPDGRGLAVVLADGHLVQIDPAEGKEVRRWKAHPPHPENNHFKNNGAVRYSPDGRSLFTFGTGANSARVWDASTGRLRLELKHDGKCYDIAFSPNGRLLATAGWDNRVCIWDLETGERAGPPLPHPDWPYTAVFSPDGGQLLTSCRDGMARLWDWRAGRLACPAMEHEHEVHDAAFSPDGRFVFTVGDDWVFRTWDRRTGQPACAALSLAGPGLCLRVSPDGRRAVVGGPADGIPIFRIDEWVRPSPLEGDELCAWAEVVSGQRIAEGNVTNLTADEWFERWRALGAKRLR
jgi:WD40 repeat protein